MFIEAAFIIAKNWKPPKCLTTGEWNANCSLLIYWKVLNHSVMSDSSWPHGLWPTKLFCPWGFSRQEYWSPLPCPPSGIFPPQGSNPSLPHCRQILYCLSHKGSPRMLEWAASPFSRGSSQPRNGTGVSCIAGGFLPAEPPGSPMLEYYSSVYKNTTDTCHTLG